MPPLTGHKIRNARKKAGVSMAEFARMCGIGEPTLSRIESGKRRPTKPVEKKIREALDALPARTTPVLNRVFDVNGLSVETCARALQIKQSTIKDILRQGRKSQVLRGRIETWLDAQGINIRGIWEPQEEPPMERVEISHRAKTHFKLFRDPFETDLNPEQFFGDDGQWPEITAIEERLALAFTQQKTVLVRGQVGAGKTTAVRRVLKRLEEQSEKLFVIQPDIIDKTQLRASLILEAILLDCNIEEAKPAMGTSLNARSRMAKKALATMCDQDYKPVLLLEEAHLLPDNTIIHLKSFSEWFQGTDKLLGVVLVGQPEMDEKIKRYKNRQWFSRCPKISMPGLGDLIPEYIKFRCQAVNVAWSKIFTESGLSEIRERMGTQRFDTPLLVGNFATACINDAARIGAKVDTNIVRKVRPTFTPDYGEVKPLKKRARK